MTKNNSLKLLIFIPLGMAIFFIMNVFVWVFNLSSSWWLTAFVIFFGLLIFFWKIIDLPKRLKIFGILGSLILGFIFTFIFATFTHDYAMYEICYPEIEKQEASVKSSMGINGMYRSWAQHEECEANILPFPWGKQAKFSLNPPGFIPKQ